MLPSSRRIITRSRNGCAVCKSKRLKCDEAKPHCSRCQRLGISCPGYQKPLRWTASSRSPSGSTMSLGSNETGSTQKRTVNDRLHTLEQSSRDLCDMDVFNQFTNMNIPGSLDFQDIGNLEAHFPLPDVSVEPERPSPSTASETSSCFQLLETNTAGMWPGIIPEGVDARSSMVERCAPSALSSTPCYETPISPCLQDNSSVLVEYYFKEVCGMMSCYDSNSNPYRTTISNLWGNSPSLYYVTQSMAAACLSEVLPGLSAVSGRLRDRAVSSLWNESNVGPTDTSSLLALVMLGFSLCWHDPSRLGQSEFELLAETVAHLEKKGRNLTLADKQKKLFFYNSLVYWKMLLSFVTDQDLPSLDTASTIHPQPVLMPTRKDARMPHPQTGIGVKVQEVVAQVGALVRRERRRIRRRQNSSRHDIEQSLNAIRSAEQLHTKLCQMELPREATVINSGDDMTPTDHLLKAAEAYRCTGLLQLYRNFPDLLSNDVSSVYYTTPSTWLDTVEDGDSNRFEDSGAFLGTRLTSIALHVLDLVEGIPISSRSRSIQPLLLVSVCSELSLSRTFVSMPPMRENSVASIITSPRMKVPPTVSDVVLARRLVVSRLSSFEGILAAKPIQQMLKLVKETWACMDKRHEDTYWMDVMIENGFETLMG